MDWSTQWLPFALWLAGFALILVGVAILRKKHVRFTARVFIAMLVGAALGVGLFAWGNGSAENRAVVDDLRRYFGLVGFGYVDFLRMLILPLIPTSIVVGIMKLQNQEELKTMGTRTVLTFLCTAAIASMLGLLIGTIMGIGNGADLGQAAPRDPVTVESIITQIRGMIPRNPLASAVNMNIIPVVVFSLFIGIAGVKLLGKNPKKVRPFQELLESFLDIMMGVTSMVLRMTPYGVVGLMAYFMSDRGVGLMVDLGWFLAALIIACVLQVLLVYAGILRFGARVKPFRFFKAAQPAMMMAFSSRSSMGTLPLTVTTLTDRVRVDSKVANFVAPIGAVMNMDACGGIYPALVAVFAANAYGIDMSVMQYVLVLFVSIVASLGTAGIPMGATQFTLVALTAAGLPVEVIGVVVGVDFLVDMFRTATNVTGDMVTATYVGSKINAFNREAFNKEEYINQTE